MLVWVNPFCNSFQVILFPIKVNVTVIATILLGLYDASKIAKMQCYCNVLNFNQFKA